MTHRHHMDELKEKGDFLFVLDQPGDRRIIFHCPRTNQLCGVALFPDTLPNDATWHWDGNAEAPTLTPSINCVGGCGWHGSLTKGVFTP